MRHRTMSYTMGTLDHHRLNTFFSSSLPSKRERSFKNAIFLLSCHFLLSTLISSSNRAWIFGGLHPVDAADSRRQQQQQQQQRRTNQNQRPRQRKSSPDDYYKILNLSKKATPKEIKSSYRKQALKYHPDKFRPDPKLSERQNEEKKLNHTQKFFEISLAYDVLSDEKKKRMYDATIMDAADNLRRQQQQQQRQRQQQQRQRQKQQRRTNQNQRPRQSYSPPVNYYKILGLSKRATPKEIKSSYRKQALKYHPDKFRPDPNLSEKKNEEKKLKHKQKFVEISLAYDVLSDEKKKKVYDRYGKSGLDRLEKGMDPGGGFGGGGGGGGVGKIVAEVLLFIIKIIFI